MQIVDFTGFMQVCYKFSQACGLLKVKISIKPGFRISQFFGELLSGIAEGENDFRNTKDFIHR